MAPKEMIEALKKFVDTDCDSMCERCPLNQENSEGDTICSVLTDSAEILFEEE
jgi:hypothetical protein